MTPYVVRLAFLLFLFFLFFVYPEAAGFQLQITSMTAERVGNSEYGS